MIYLFLQTWVWMIAAALVGLLAGRLIWRGRGQGTDSAPADAVVEAAPEELETLRHELLESRKKRDALENLKRALEMEREQLLAEKKRLTTALESHENMKQTELPQMLEDDGELEKDPEVASVPQPGEEPPDDLQKIRGIGPVMEKSLNRMGVFYFHQIAGLTEEQIRYVNKRLGFYGRIEREKWIEQAAELVKLNR